MSRSLLALALVGGVVLATAQWSQVTVNGPLTFAVIGDWGRTGGVKSVTNATMGGFDTTGFCISKFGSKVEDDIVGAPSQASAAAVMELAANISKPNFVLNMGDNFYECGLDNPLRVWSDWGALYLRTDQSPNLANLVWYSIIGNHDLPQNSVPLQLDFAMVEPQWYMPARTYVTDFTSVISAGNVTMRVVAINTNPFVSSYHKSSSGYYGTEVLTYGTPQALSAQLDWINGALNSSTADWLVVIGHHPMVSGAGTTYGFNYTAIDPTSSFDLGPVDADGNPAWTQLLNIIRNNNVDVYFNGHDHVLTHTVDPVDPVKWQTQYVTSGAGSAASAGDACGALTRPYVKWTNVINPPANCSVATNYSSPGFNMASVTKTTFTVDFWTVPDYTKAAGQNAYSFTITKSSK